MSTVSKRFRLSGKGLAKKCQKYKIPCPPRGYWARKASGQRISPTRLPINRDPALDTVILHERPLVEKPSPPKADPREKHYADIARAFTFPENITRYHRAISRCRQGVREASEYDRQDQLGRVRFRLNTPDVGLRVTPACFDRGCRFLQGFIELCEQLGWTFVEKHYRSGCAPRYQFHSEGETLYLQIKEIVSRLSEEERRASEPAPEPGRVNFAALLKRTKRYRATGILSVSIEPYRPGTQSQWQDTDAHAIEDYLPDIIKSMIHGFQHAKECRIRHRQQEERRRREQLKRKVREEEVKREGERQRRLEEEAEEYAKCIRIREWLAAMKNKMGEDARFDTWHDWAQHTVNQRDPLMNAESVLETFHQSLKVDREAAEKLNQDIAPGSKDKDVDLPSFIGILD